MFNYQKIILWFASISTAKLSLLFLVIKMVIGNNDGDGSPPPG